MSLLRLVFVSSLIFSVDAYAANVYYCANTHTSQTAIANAIQNSPTVPQSIKNSACGYAAMAAIEAGSGDGTTANQCLGNDTCCTGVLQLYGAGVKAAGYVTPSGQPDKAAYANASLQAQIDAWGTTAAGNITSQGYQTLNAAYQSGQTVGGQTVTPGMLAACEQFGAQQCNQNVSAMQQGGGSCGVGSHGNPTVCSWGNTADNKAAKGSCTAGGGSNGAIPCSPTPASAAPNGMPTTPAPAQDIMLNVG